MKCVMVADAHIDRSSGQWIESEGMLSSWISAVRALEESVNVFIDHDADVFCLLGDTFNTGHPTAQAVHIVTSQLKRVQDAGGKIIAVVGNHELSGVKPGAENPVEVFLPLVDAHVFSDLGFIDIGNVRFFGLPWLDTSRIHSDSSNGGNAEGIIESELAAFADSYVDEMDHNVVLGHCMIGSHGERKSDADMDSIVNEPIVDAEWFDAFDEVFLGHIHHRHDVFDKIHYVGSPFQITRADAGDLRGCELVEFHDDHTVDRKFIPFNDIVGEFSVVDIVGVDGISAAQEIKKLEVSEMDTVVIVNDGELDKHVVKAVEKLRDQGITVKVVSVAVEQEAVVGSVDMGLSDDSSIEDGLRTWLSHKGYQDDVIDETMQLVEDDL